MCLQCAIKHVSTAIPYINEYIADPVLYFDRIALACGELNHAEMELGVDYLALRVHVRQSRLSLEEGVFREGARYSLQELLRELLLQEQLENTPPEERE